MKFKITYGRESFHIFKKHFKFFDRWLDWFNVLAIRSFTLELSRWDAHWCVQLRATDGIRIIPPSFATFIDTFVQAMCATSRRGVGTVGAARAAGFRVRDMPVTRLIRTLFAYWERIKARALQLAFIRRPDKFERIISFRSCPAHARLRRNNDAVA